MALGDQNKRVVWPKIFFKDNNFIQSPLCFFFFLCYSTWAVSISPQNANHNQTIDKSTGINNFIVAREKNIK